MGCPEVQGEGLKLAQLIFTEIWRFHSLSWNAVYPNSSTTSRKVVCEGGTAQCAVGGVASCSAHHGIFILIIIGSYQWNIRAFQKWILQNSRRSFKCFSKQLEILPHWMGTSFEVNQDIKFWDYLEISKIYILQNGSIFVRKERQTVQTWSTF